MGVNIEVNATKCFSLFLLSQTFGGILMESNRHKFRLLNNRRKSIYLNVAFKNFCHFFVFAKSLHKCYLMEITKTIGKERSTACSHGSCWYADVRVVVEKMI